MNKGNKAHNDGYLTQGPTLLTVIIVVVFECNPTGPTGRPAPYHSLTRWRIQVTILEPGIGQLCVSSNLLECLVYS